MKIDALAISEASEWVGPESVGSDQLGAAWPTFAIFGAGSVLPPWSRLHPMTAMARQPTNTYRPSPEKVICSSPSGLLYTIRLDYKTLAGPILTACLLTSRSGVQMSVVARKASDAQPVRP